MKKLMTLIGAVALLSSCSRYYINTVESTSVKKDQYTGEFKFENDSVAITYNFNGENDAPINIDIYNKLNEPLYINWQQSAIIYGDQATSYLGEKIKTEGVVALTSYHSSGSFRNPTNTNFSWTDGKISASTEVQKEISFIPPKSRIKKSPLKINPVKYGDIPESNFVKGDLERIQGPNASGKTAHFNAENTPMAFKSYITLFTMAGNTPKPVSLQQDFYISSLIKTSNDPKGMLLFDNKPGNVFFVSEASQTPKKL